MPRQPRQIFKGEYYHILSRGNNRGQLFYGQRDFSFFLNSLLKYKVQYGVSIFHYCLMTNHVHFLMRSEKEDPGISRLMHGVQTSYAIYFQKKHGFTGHVFENRFKSYRIDKDAYLLECGRYIERNPVRAGMVKDPQDYSWSSYGFYSEGRTNEILSTNPLFLTLGANDAERRMAYQAYVATPRVYESILDRFFDEHVLIA